ATTRITPAVRRCRTLARWAEGLPRAKPKGARGAAGPEAPARASLQVPGSRLASGKPRVDGKVPPRAVGRRPRGRAKAAGKAPQKKHVKAPRKAPRKRADAAASRRDRVVWQNLAWCGPPWPG